MIQNNYKFIVVFLASSCYQSMIINWYQILHDPMVDNASRTMASQSPAAPDEKKRKGKEGYPIPPRIHLPHDTPPKNNTGGFLFVEDVQSTPRKRKNSRVKLVTPESPTPAGRVDHPASSPSLMPVARHREVWFSLY